jgi:cytochrome d ubiquinol oxidase subunit I
MSGYLIVLTDAWMQNPVAYRLGPNGEIILTSFWGLLLNPWGVWQYVHNMSGAVITGAFVMAAVGAFYLLTKQFAAHAKAFVRVGVIAGLVASLFQLIPSGDAQGRMVAHHQPVTLAAMEGLFATQKGAPVAIVGQPDVERQRLDNPLQIPRALSFLTYRRWMSEVKGLDAFPQQDWPDNVALLYYSYHIMVGLGTIFIAIMLLAAWKLRGGTLYDSRGMLWVLMLSLPFPYIANTAGWMTAEFGRQPWLIYGLMRTQAGVSPQVSSGNVWFTLIGFMGMYTVLSILFLFLVYRVIEEGPEAAESSKQ